MNITSTNNHQCAKAFYDIVSDIITKIKSVMQSPHHATSQRMSIISQEPL